MTDPIKLRSHIGSYANPNDVSKAEIQVGVVSKTHTGPNKDILGPLGRGSGHTLSVKNLVAKYSQKAAPPAAIVRSGSRWVRPSVNTSAPGDAGLGSRLQDVKDALFRADRRTPSDIFANGFQAKGTRENIMDYIKFNHPSNFISTTRSPKIAVEFATRNAGARYIYVIRPQGNRIDVNQELEQLGWKNPKSFEEEIVFRSGIPPSNIFGAQRIDTLGRPIGEFIYNKRYIFHRPGPAAKGRS
jgi:Pertussis toxin, subunit 1